MSKKVKTYSYIIRESREYKEYSRHGLAETIGVRDIDVFNWENGKSFPDEKAQKKLEKLLRIKLPSVIVFEKALDEYETEPMSLTGIVKSDYIGKYGTVFHKMEVDNNTKTRKSKITLYDAVFEDGMCFCFEPEQVKFVNERW